MQSVSCRTTSFAPIKCIQCTDCGLFVSALNMPSARPHSEIIVGQYITIDLLKSRCCHFHRYLFYLVLFYVCRTSLYLHQIFE